MNDESMVGHQTTEAEEGSVLPAGRLERIIGKPQRAWTLDDLIDVVRDRKIRLLSLMHIGGDGWLKTLDFVPQDQSHLRDILIGGERADGSSLFGSLGIRPGASDIMLRPRLETAFLHPFAAEPTLAVLCAHLGRDGVPLQESPDTIVRRAYQRALDETGIDLHALGEVEYFLGRRPQNEDVYGEADRGYHAVSPFVFGDSLRNRAMIVLAELGVPVKYSHSEVGYVEADEMSDFIWEQHEIELALQPLPQAADAPTLTAWVLRNLAVQAGWRCSFDPVIREGHAGSGLHFHFSPMVNGEHRGTFDDSGELLQEAQWLIGGLARMGGALMAFGNCKASSFVRLSQAKEAPNSVTWGQFNRKTLIRLPVVPIAADGRQVAPPTIEFRLPDGSANPHTLLAGIAQALVEGHRLEGLAELLARTNAQAAAENPQDVTYVPRSFADIASQLEAHRAVFEAGGVFPPHVVDKLIDSLGTGRWLK